MEVSHSQCDTGPHSQDTTAELNHATPEPTAMPHGDSEPSTHRHATSTERYEAALGLLLLTGLEDATSGAPYDAAARPAQPTHSVPVRSAVYREAATEAVNGAQLGLEEASCCESTEPFHSAPGAAHVAESALHVVIIHSEHEDTTASDATSTPVSATHTSDKRKRKRTYSAMTHATGGRNSGAGDVVRSRRSTRYLRDKAGPEKLNVESRVAIASHGKATVSVTSSGVTTSQLRAAKMSAEGRMPVSAAPGVFFERGDTESGLDSSVTTNAAAAAPSMSVMNAPNPSNQIRQPKTMEPSVLTHIIEEHIILEGFEPFAIDYKSRVVDLVPRMLSLGAYE